MTDPSPARFFAVVLRPGRTLGAATFVVLGTAVWVAVNDRDDIFQVSVLALFVQMFAAATGYRERAFRGHFDPMLVAGSPRRAVAGWHWALSAAPGALVWLVLGAVQSSVGATVPAAPFTLSGVVAFFYVSVVAWAVALPLTRYASGVLWVVALTVLGGFSQLRPLHEAFLTGGTGWRSVLAQAAASLICPMFLIERTPLAALPSLVIVVVVSVAVVAAGAWFIVVSDAPLRSS